MKTMPTFIIFKRWKGWNQNDFNHNENVFTVVKGLLNYSPFSPPILISYSNFELIIFMLITEPSLDSSYKIEQFI